MGAAHWCDVPFVFDMLADRMHATWVHFITTGNPG